MVWSNYLGRNSGCGGPSASKIQGITSEPVVTIAVVNGVSQPVMFIGGGGDIGPSGAVITGATAQVLALNALTGAVLWRTSIGSAPSHYAWGSPRYVNGSLYMGISSLGDCPLVQGGLVQIDAASGAILHTFATVPSGCLGASIWGSATADTSGNIYVVTGNPAKTCTAPSPYGEAMLEFSPSLGLLGSWQIPAAERGPDGDFGTTPTMFTGTVTPGGASMSLVGAVNKNGVYYVFQQNNLSAGPVARLRVANGTSAYLGSVSPSSYDGTHLYVAGGATTIAGTAYAGSLRAFDPNNLGTPLWELGFTDGAVLGAVASDPGLAIVDHSAAATVVDTGTGNVLFTGIPPAASYPGSASIAHGVIYVGDSGGSLHAYSVNGT